MKNLMDMQPHELEAMLKEWGEPAFRHKQVYGWLMKGVRPADMANVPTPLRERLSLMPFGGAEICDRRVSGKDGTVKYLFRLDDGELVEGVLMRYHHGNTLCLSTQAGCRMNCTFCASALGGLRRNLTQGEMLSEVLAVERHEKLEEKERVVTNIVMMGSGEPLDNFDQVVGFLIRATAPDGLGISARNISLSTCGLAPAVHRLYQEAPPITLCISLHAHDDALRDTLLPVNKRFPIAEVLDAAKAYADKTGRRVIFEYILIEGLNASKPDAVKLARLIKGIPCHVNLIPLNALPEKNLKGVTRKHAAMFAKWLEECGVSATVRREMGTDIEGACGQLRRRVLKGDTEP